MTLDEKTLNEIVDCFVSVYGEQYRQNINEKVHNCLILLCGYKSTEERKKIKDEINKKYLVILIKKIREIINLTEKEFLFFFGSSIFENNDIIGAFSSTAQKIVDMEPKSKVAQFNANQILQIRGEFASFSSNTISVDIADKLIQLYDETSNQAKIELFNNSINYNENKLKLAEYTFLENPLFSRDFYDFDEQKHNGVQPNFIKDSNGNIQLFPIISFSTVKNSMSRMFNSPDYFDVLLIHEINHVIGMHLLDFEDTNNYKVQMGLVESDKGNNITKYSYMDYIDEIFNQNIAKRVTNLLHDKGIYLIDSPNKSQVEDSSLYEMGEFLLKDFFALFYNDILKLYISGGKLNEFYAKIDETELRFLGTLIEEYLRRSDILDLKESDNLEYEKRTKDIIERIKNSIKMEKVYEVVSILDLNDLNNLTSDSIKTAYNESLKIFNELDDSELKNKIIFSLSESLRYALEHIEDIKTIEGISTNKANAQMYNIQKVDIFKYLNKKNPLILQTIVTKLEESGISINIIIKFIHSLEYGLIIPSVFKKIIELFGEDTYQSLIKFTTINQNDFETIELLCNHLESNIINSINSSIKK